MERDKSLYSQSEFHASFSSLERTSEIEYSDGAVETADISHPIPVSQPQPSEPHQVEPELPVSIYVAPEIDNQDRQKTDGQLNDLSANISAPYDIQLKKLSKLWKQLQPSSTSETNITEEREGVPEPAQPILYLTPFGSLSFDQLHERTRKYAAFVLQHTYHVSPTDVDDGLQAGYAHLWQHLKQEPDYLNEKQMAWIGKGIVYQGLHVLRGDWKYQNHVEVDEGRTSTDRCGRQSGESRQVDMRVDIQQAISRVAQQILGERKGKQADYELWALYGLTMLRVSSTELSRMFGVRAQSMQQAYNYVRLQLQEALPHYAPRGKMQRVRQRGAEKLPQQDIPAIRKANKLVSDAVYDAVQNDIDALDADTRRIDERALDGIRQGISVSTHARTHQVPQYQMQRAYKRVHLMIGAKRDPTIHALKPEHRTKYVFTLTPDKALAVERLAYELLVQSKSYEKLVALHAHISNLAISTTAKNFNIPTSTLRYYIKQIGSRLKTPIEAAKKI